MIAAASRRRHSAVHREAVLYELRKQPLPSVAAPVPHEVVERRPTRPVERYRKEKRCVRCGNTRKLRQRTVVIVDMLDDVERANEIEGAVRKRNRRHEAQHGARSTLAQSRKCRRAEVDSRLPLPLQLKHKLYDVLDRAQPLEPFLLQQQARLLLE